MSRPSPLLPTPEILEIVRSVAMEGWRARAKERGLPEPSDLSGSCKFTSLLLRRLFGGRLRGNEGHQFLELSGGQRLDLNEWAQDVVELRAKGLDPWRHDPLFWNNPDHRASLRSCEARVDLWETEVRSRLLQANPHDPSFDLS